MAKKYVSLSKLSTFLDNLKNLFATKDTVESISTNVAYINTTDNETITDTETSSSSVTVDSYLSTTSTNPVQNKVVTKKINEISQAVEDNAQAIEENAKIDVTASVGQTIVVKEVDENGKPTAWEAADYQEKICGSGLAEILPETTLEFNEDVGGFVFSADITLVIGNKYTVNYNEVDYETECVDGTDLGVGFVLGNLDLLAGTGDTGEPFCIVYESTMSYGLVAAFDGAESVVLSISGERIYKIPDIYLPIQILSAGSVFGSARTLLARAEDEEYVMGQGAFAEGTGTTASGDSSHAEGTDTIASGGSSHAEGTGTTASGDSSHAEGTGTIASGGSSHAEGTGTTASGDSSHAEGTGTIASGDYSHAEGTGTIASGDYSHAEGRFNIEDADDKYAHIVGNGRNEKVRSNAYTLDWHGNAWFAGGIELTSPNGTRYRFTVSDGGVIIATVVE